MVQKIINIILLLPGSCSKPVVTEIAPYKAFYSAEKYHQDYYNNNKNQPYFSMVIHPKVDKFKKVFAAEESLKRSALQFNR
jgi:peptide-methionine (S)-S-oxide reductase